MLNNGVDIREDTVERLLAREFYPCKARLTDPVEFVTHDEYARRRDGSLVSIANEAWAAFKATVFSPLSGWRF